MISRIAFTYPGGILASMNELDEAWSRMVEGAIANAKASGRDDVADFLNLKRSNDMIRQASVDWLFGTLIEVASEANRQQASITIEREDPHEFKYGNATMAGSLVRVKFGVRNLTVEAGWTRLPAHGVMRNGSLAAARIRHFGLPKADEELSLVREGEIPVWKVSGGASFDSYSVRRHVVILLGI
jgi:hypothetical protein